MMRNVMSRKIKHCVVFIFLLSFSAFLIIGCGNTSQNQNSLQIKNETQETKSSIISQYELIETLKYKELKIRVEKAKNEVNELETKKNKLAVLYTEEYPPHKKVLNKLQEAKERLTQLESLLDEEIKKLEKRPINPPV